MVKRSAATLLPGAHGQVFTAVGLAEGDRLVDVRLTQGDEDLLLFTQQGMAIRFKQEEVRPMGLPAGGVVGIKLSEGDSVVSLGLVNRSNKALEVVIGTSDGRAKRMASKEFPVQGRAGKGVAVTKITDGAMLADAVVAAPEDTITYLTSKNHAKSLKAKHLTRRSRAAAGDEIITLSAKERLARLLVVE
jgi:DNA gyrase subunit A